MQVMSNGRVRRTQEEWREIVTRWEKSGLSPREFCRNQEIQLSSFLRWRQRVKAPSIQDEFVALTPRPLPTSCWSLEVTLPNGSKLRFQG